MDRSRPRSHSGKGQSPVSLLEPGLLSVATVLRDPCRLPRCGASRSVHACTPGCALGILAAIARGHLHRRRCGPHARGPDLMAPGGPGSGAVCQGRPWAEEGEEKALGRFQPQEVHFLLGAGLGDTLLPQGRGPDSSKRGVSSPGRWLTG